MKNKILRYSLVISSLIPLTATAAESMNGTVSEACDTVIKIENPGKVLVKEFPNRVQVVDGNSIVLYQQNFEPTEVIKSRTFISKKGYSLDPGGINVEMASGQNHKWNLTMGGVGIGLNGAINQPKGTGLQWGRSFDITWLQALAAEYCWDRQAISFGLGFDWKNFRLTGAPLRMIKSQTGGVTLAPYPEDVNPINSNLKIFSLGIPVLYSINVPKIYTKFTVGPILNFNTYSSIKTTYFNPDGNKTTEIMKNVGQKKVTFDILGAATWNCIGLYIRYSPLKEMKKSSDINFNPLAIGLMLLL